MKRIIEYTDFKDMSLLDKSQKQYIFTNYMKPKLEKPFLDIGSMYLDDFSYYKYEIIKELKIDLDYALPEDRLRFYCYKDDDKNFKKEFYNNFKLESEIIYDKTIRRKLIELEIILPSVANQKRLRKEFLDLDESLKQKKFRRDLY